MKVTLTLWQRFNLDGIMRQQRMGDGEDFLALLDLWRKLAVSDALRKDYQRAPCSACGQGRLWDMDALALVEPLTLDLEKAEVRKLSALISGWRQFTVDDADWLTSIKAQLAAAGEGGSPAAAAPSARSRRH